jgi:hypothetical protein
MAADRLTAWVFSAEPGPAGGRTHSSASDPLSDPLSGRLIRIVSAFIEVTGAVDGLSHRVPQRLYEEGLTSGAGTYQAACGRAVLAAAMATGPGRECPLCRAAVTLPRRTAAAASPGR